LLRIGRARGGPRGQHPAAESRPQAPGNPFRKVCKMSKNRRVSAAHNPYYHVWVGMQTKIFSARPGLGEGGTRP
jgi:hypothetical protein